MSSAPAALPTSPLLAGYLRQLESIRAEAAGLTGDLSDAQFRWRPEPGKWSAAEVVRHLTLADESYLAPMDRAVADARARGRTDRGDWKPSFVGRLMVGSMAVPPKRKMGAPKLYRPTGAEEVDRVAALAEWRRVQDGIEERIRGAEGVDLRRSRVVSPVSRLIRMNLGDAFALLLAHERRHLWQLGRLREHPGFPAS